MYLSGRLARSATSNYETKWWLDDQFEEKAGVTPADPHLAKRPVAFTGKKESTRWLGQQVGIFFLCQLSGSFSILIPLYWMRPPEERGW
jgi:hypothetical protein